MTDPLPPDLSVERIEELRREYEEARATYDHNGNHWSFPVDPKEMAALLSLAHSAASGSEWRPIESAPKDGTAILIWQPYKAYVGVGQGFDDWRYGIGYWRTDGSESWGNRNSAEVTPLYWQPLPPPPTKKEPENG